MAMQTCPRLYFLKNLIFSLLIIASVLTGCVVDNQPAEPNDVSVTPLPTSTLSDFATPPSSACMVAKRVALQVSNQQGDLLAWSPAKDALAYVGPRKQSLWLVGELKLTTGPNFEEAPALASNVVGDLTWSPDGTFIAFVALRLGDNLYTVEIIQPAGTDTQDLFPEELARTDEWSSQKDIVGWVDENTLLVLTSCGVDCLQPIEINVIDGTANLSSPSQQRGADFWAIHYDQPPDPLAIPVEGDTGIYDLSWSPDNSAVAYLAEQDEYNNLWVFSADDETPLHLEVGQWQRIQETKWSYTGEYLAVRADSDLLIFSSRLCP
jgi:WD40 repeat protein